MAKTNSPVRVGEESTGQYPLHALRYEGILKVKSRSPCIHGTDNRMDLDVLLMGKTLCRHVSLFAFVTSLRNPNIYKMVFARGR